MGKTPFNGKNYNEILAQNRAADIKLTGPEYLRVPSSAMDLLKKCLEKVIKFINFENSFQMPLYNNSIIIISAKNKLLLNSSTFNKQDPKLRITSQEAVNHPFITEEDKKKPDQSYEDDEVNVEGNIGEFDKSNRFDMSKFSKSP